MAYLFTLGLAVFEIAVFFLTNLVKGVGPKRGAAITGWISLFVGSALVINAGLVGYNQAVFYLLSSTSAIAILAVLFILVSISRPQVFLTILGEFFKP